MEHQENKLKDCEQTIEESSILKQQSNNDIKLPLPAA